MSWYVHLWHIYDVLSYGYGRQSPMYRVLTALIHGVSHIMHLRRIPHVRAAKVLTWGYTGLCADGVGWR